ncbi:MAG: 30S ribosomal protein S6 [Verrucomicrobiales bacterium]|jgi:small subunit ribosomal protein S6|nr:30S ribosomal protein S6 [Verrucomicrobiales bacterium]
MKQYYEAMFILDIQGKEEGVDAVLTVIKQAIEGLDGVFKGAQRLEHRRFERVAVKKHNSGYYLGVTFELDPAKLKELQEKFKFNDKIFRQSYLRSKPVVVKEKQAEPAAA